MAIPAGLFLLHKNQEHSDLNLENEINGNVVGDGLFDNLFKMMGGRKKKVRKTRRHKKKKRKTTHKRRKKINN